jgi:hypothetical protein
MGHGCTTNATETARKALGLIQPEVLHLLRAAKPLQLIRFAEQIAGMG